MNPSTIFENKIQSHDHITSKKQKLSIAQHKMYLGKETTQNLAICILHKFKTMKQYNVISLHEKPLHFVDYLTTNLCTSLSCTPFSHKLHAQTCASDCLFSPTIAHQNND